MKAKELLPGIVLLVLPLMPGAGAAGSSRLILQQVIRDGDGGVRGLNGPMGVAASPDGLHIYVVSQMDNELGVFSRNPLNGQLSFVQWLKDGHEGVDGLDGANAVAVSPDGRSVYVVGEWEDALAVFDRDATTGRLDFAQVFKRGVGGVDGLTIPQSVTVSPDGRNVYLTGGYLNDAGVVVFSRDAAGHLTLFQVRKQGVDGVEGMDRPQSVTVSPDGRNVYIADNGKHGLFSNGLVVFSRDAGNGGLSFVQTLTGEVAGAIAGPGYASVIVSPDGANVYVCSFLGVAVYTRDSQGRLKLIQGLEDNDVSLDGLDGAEALAISPDGRQVYVAGATDDSLVVFRRDSTSSGALVFVQALKDGSGGVDGLDRVFSVTVTADGKHVYAVGLNDDAIAVFDRSSTDGRLSFAQVLRDDQGGLDGLDGAAGVAFSRDGSQVYVAGFQDDAVVTFVRDAATGTLTRAQLLKDGVGGVDGLSRAAAVAVSPDSKNIYVAGSSDDAVAVFNRDATDGQLSFAQVLKDGVGGVDGLDGANDVTVSPDGKNVYLAGIFDNALAVFSRDPATGQLAFVQVIKDGDAGLNGLGYACAVTVSGDGKNVYAAGMLDSAVVAFSRDPATGQLVFLQTIKDGVGGVDGLAFANSVTVSPDGQTVYATGWSDHAVAVLSRDAGSGQLRFVQVLNDGVDGVFGLDGARHVTVSPDNQRVYATGDTGSALAVFDRDPATGQLSFAFALTDKVNGVDGLAGASWVALSPDGQNLYVTGSEDDAVAVFRIPLEPSLSIQHSATGLTILWERPAGGFVLEQAPVLVSPSQTNTWTEAPAATYQTNATHIFVTLPTPAGDRFFRLHKP